MRIELAQAERDLKLQQHTIDGLRDELDQAHAIFDSIHQHPIAGPIVRTRKRVMDWLKNSDSSSKEGN